MLIIPLGQLAEGRTQTMEIAEDRGGGDFLYYCTVTCEDSGRYGFTARVGARADDWIRYTPGLLTWAQSHEHSELRERQTP